MAKLNYRFVPQILAEKGYQLFGARNLVQLFGVSPRAARDFISRYLKSKHLVQVRNGLYFWSDNQPPEFLIANVAYQPSYVSLETALSYYHLIPESIYGVTSVTTRATQSFTSSQLRYQYYKIKTIAFVGYTPLQVDGQTVLIATPAKAVMDYLYFVSLGRKTLLERLDISRAGLSRVDLEPHLKVFDFKPLQNLWEKINL